MHLALFRSSIIQTFLVASRDFSIECVMLDLEYEEYICSQYLVCSSPNCISLHYDNVKIVFQIFQRVGGGLEKRHSFYKYVFPSLFSCAKALLENL